MSEDDDIPSIQITAVLKYLTNCFLKINNHLITSSDQTGTTDVLSESESRRIKDKSWLERIAKVKSRINDNWSTYWVKLHLVELEKIKNALKIVYDQVVNAKTPKDTKDLENYREMPPSHSLYIQILNDLYKLKLNTCYEEESFLITGAKVSDSKTNVEWMLHSLEHMANCISNEEYIQFSTMKDKWPLISKDIPAKDKDILLSYQQNILSNWGRCWKRFTHEGISDLEIIKKLYSSCILVQTGKSHLSVQFSENRSKWKKCQSIWKKIMRKCEPDKEFDKEQNQQRPTEQPTDKELVVLELIRLLRSCIFVLGYEKVDAEEYIILEYIPESSRTESKDVAKVIRERIKKKHKITEKPIDTFLSHKAFHPLPNDPDLTVYTKADLRFLKEFLHTFLEYACKVLESKTDAIYYIPERLMKYQYVWTLCKQFENIRNLHNCPTSAEIQAHEQMKEREETAQTSETHFHCAQNYEMALGIIRNEILEDSELKCFDKDVMRVCPTCQNILLEHMKSMKEKMLTFKGRFTVNRETQTMAETSIHTSDNLQQNVKDERPLDRFTVNRETQTMAETSIHTSDNLQQNVKDERPLDRCTRNIMTQTIAETTIHNSDKLLQTVRDLSKERETLLNRLSKFVGARLKDGNAAITDLSDPNRPLKLAEQYGEIYDTNWTNALEYLIASGKDEKECTRILLELLTDSYTFCVEMSDLQWKVIAGSFCMKEEENMSKLVLEDAEMHQIKVIRRNTADISKREVIENFLRNHQELAEKLPLRTYMTKCVSICWFMMVQDPPLVIKYNFQKGDLFDKDFLKEYTQLGDKISFLVWPALLLHSNGPVLQKGVAQPISGRSKTARH